jgi:uncharacterized protein
MSTTLTGLVAGLLFGAGLTLARMTDPAVVLGFLDVRGAWNPSLLFVMGGATSTFGLLYWLATRRARPILWNRLRVPRERPLDRPLFVGTATFGIGWGLAGLCPGPAVTSLASGRLSIVAFVVAMVCGIGVADWLRARA